MKRGLIIGAVLLFSLNLFGQLPYQNPKLTSEERAKDLISRLSLQEKATLMCDQSEAIPRLGIKKFNWWSEALHGLAQSNGVTVFPEPIGMAASFDEKLVYNVFDAVSDEFRAKYNQARKNGEENRAFLNLSVWTPNINIFRDPRWGRGQETYGEDPYLTSRMGISVVNGLQGPSDSRYKKLLACAKHFAVHSGPEWSRHTLNLNNISQRDLWETYLPAFKSLVQEADVREVMCAYQRLDDEPCCGSNRLLEKILRDDWGFKYLVVSDCGAIADFYNNHKVSSDDVHAASKAVLAGTDVECGFGYAFGKLPQAVKKGLITEDEINKHLMRVLTGRFDLGEMDNDSLVSWSKIPMSVVNSKDHQKLTLQMAQESMTLLQNKNNILPLFKSEKKIAVIGPNADEKPVMLGNYNGYPANIITVLDGIKSKLPASAIFYDKGCDLTEDMITESLVGSSSFDGKTGIKASYWNNKDFKGDIAAHDQITNPVQLTTAGQHQFGAGVNLKGFSGKYETVYKALRSEMLVFKLEYAGKCQIVVNGDTLLNKDSYQAVPFRIPFKVEAGKEYKIEIWFSAVFDWADASLKLNFGREIPVNYDDLISKLKGIDVVVFVGGISSKLEGEEMPIEIPGFKGGDRTDINLPASQRKYLQALKKAGKKVVFVNCSGSAIALTPETESCDAILQAWYGGQSGGQAVADVLFGDYNPSGKLPITFYKNSDQLGNFEDYSMKGRTYRFMNDALFPFGYGLSYTTFKIGEARLSKTDIGTSETIQLTVPVTNAGKRDGVEVVQVYIRKVNDIEGPLKTLRGFNRVEIPAGKSQEVSINLNPSSFEFFEWKQGKMVVTPGEYEIYYGNSSDVKDLKMVKVAIR
ncbi:xylan 1,4-beta-xylosidase [Mucilaginibacter sp.]|uniref:xylan 1,4-beta-xylosidase n=1 Tax=Mucilaginibacter sp. TaxID=1882438 RepID=UPI0028521BE8|nr:xylan 1,4-beta-xylosidase [Mucilaginibacter sp.]MDR3693221.1 glycoside hydrolase family 3 C-terminal domain-containing protein [Mucilaginibacter sp.]